MATMAIITSWGANIAGREQVGLGVFMGAIQYFTERKHRGDIDDLRVYVANDGDLANTGGHMVVEGTAAQLAALTERDDYQQLILKAAHVVHGLRTSSFTTGDAILKRVEMLQGVRKELGL